jgi:hypothetical protein
MLIVLGGLAEFKHELIRARTGEGRRGEQRHAWPEANLHASAEARGDQVRQSWQGDTGRDCAFLQWEPLDDFEARSLREILCGFYTHN